LITPHASWSIVDAQLTLIVIMGQCRRHTLFCLKWLPLLCIWIIATNWHTHYQHAERKKKPPSLMLTFRIGWGVCCFYFCPLRWSVPYWVISATNPHLHDPRCTANWHWPSVDTHFQNGALTVILVLWPILAANLLGMHNRNQITFHLSWLQEE
jgi:hypothetical protein